MKKGLIFFLSWILCSDNVWSQGNASPVSDIRQGNKLFLSNKFAEAEIAYRKALEKDPTSKEANYNLGTAQYQQQKFEDAITTFKKATVDYKGNKQKQAAGFHNLGNAYYMNKKTEEAIRAYKDALKLNPADMDTKYNLVLAMKEKQKQDQQKQQNQQNQSQQNKDKKDKDDKGEGNKDQQDKGKGNEDDKNKGNNKGDEKPGDNKSDGEGDDNGGKEPKERKGQMSKEQAEKLLEALQNEEKKTQEKMQRLKGKPKPVKVEKDW
jgi:Ca-activated chloride channel family protein